MSAVKSKKSGKRETAPTTSAETRALPHPPPTEGEVRSMVQRMYELEEELQGVQTLLTEGINAEEAVERYFGPASQFLDRIIPDVNELTSELDFALRWVPSPDAAKPVYLPPRYGECPKCGEERVMYTQMPEVAKPK